MTKLEKLQKKIAKEIKSWPQWKKDSAKSLFVFKSRTE